MLAEVATGEPQGRYPDVAGPETQDLVDMARRTNEVRGHQVRLVPTWSGLFGTSMAGDVLLPGEVTYRAHHVRRMAGRRRSAMSAGRHLAVRDGNLPWCGQRRTRRRHTPHP